MHAAVACFLHRVRHLAQGAPAALLQEQPSQALYTSPANRCRTAEPGTTAPPAWFRDLSRREGAICRSSRVNWGLCCPTTFITGFTCGDTMRGGGGVWVGWVCRGKAQLPTMHAYRAAQVWQPRGDARQPAAAGEPAHCARSFCQPFGTRAPGSPYPAAPHMAAPLHGGWAGRQAAAAVARLPGLAAAWRQLRAGSPAKQVQN